MAPQEVGQANSKTGTTVPGPAPPGRGGQRSPPPPAEFGGEVPGKAAVCAKTQRHHQHDLERKAEGEGQMEPEEPGTAGAKGRVLQISQTTALMFGVMPPMIYY